MRAQEMKGAYFRFFGGFMKAALKYPLKTRISRQ